MLHLTHLLSTQQSESGGAWGLSSANIVLYRERRENHSYDVLTPSLTQLKDKLMLQGNKGLHLGITNSALFSPNFFFQDPHPPPPCVVFIPAWWEQVAAYNPCAGIWETSLHQLSTQGPHKVGVQPSCFPRAILVAMWRRS